MTLPLIGTTVFLIVVGTGHSISERAACRIEWPHSYEAEAYMENLSKPMKQT